MTYNALSKFQLVDGPLQHMPHKCAACDRYSDIDGSELKFIEWGFEVEFFGKIYICVSCVGEMASQIGFVPISDFQRVLNEREELEAKSDEWYVELMRYKNAVAGLDSVGISLPIPNSVNSNVSAADENKPIGAVKTSRKPTAVKSESTKQINEQGHSGVPSDASLDNFIDKLDI